MRPVQVNRLVCWFDRPHVHEQCVLLPSFHKPDIRNKFEQCSFLIHVKCFTRSWLSRCIGVRCSTDRVLRYWLLILHFQGQRGKAQAYYQVWHQNSVLIKRRRFRETGTASEVSAQTQSSSQQLGWHEIVPRNTGTIFPSYVNTNCL